MEDGVTGSEGQQQEERVEEWCEEDQDRDDPPELILGEVCLDDTESADSGTPTEFQPHVLPEDGPSYSLAMYKTTPRVSRYLVGAFMLASHLMYLYGQVFPMWRLYYMVDLDVTLKATNLESKALFSELGWNKTMEFRLKQEEDIDTFTYGFAVKQLWIAKNLGSKFGPRFAAGILVLFSGVWPHAKLLLLNLYFLKPVSEIARTSAFYWLSTFGKFSLADVFVVCVMIGVLNLDLQINPTEIRDGLIAEIPEAVTILKDSFTKKEAEKEICSTLLKLHCDHWYDLGCKACEGFVGKVYDNPSFVESLTKDALQGVHTTGGGSAQLRIAGLHGIYIFCFAVVTSLLLSFFIDVLDHRARARNAKSRRGQPPLGALGVTGSPGYSYYSLISMEASQNGACPESSPARGGQFQTSSRLPVGEDTSGAVLLIRRVSRRVWPMRNYILLSIGAVLSLAVVLTGIFVNSMERQVPGSLPQIANKILGIEWSKQYSLWTLTEVTGQSGGPDFLLMGTFAFFVVIGPILRAALCIIDVAVPMSKTVHKRFMTVINLLGAFCAWEVFFVALFLVDLEMPQITNTILDDADTSLCRNLHAAGFPRSCFEVEFNVLDSYLFVVFGGALLMLVASMTVKLSFKGLDPYLDGDRGGPYCCDWCPYVMFDFDRDIRHAKELAERRALLQDDHLHHHHVHHHHHHHHIHNADNRTGVRIFLQNSADTSTSGENGTSSSVTLHQE